MTRTPDEIKKGLADNIAVHYHPGDREPRLTPMMMVELEELHADALALIQQLQAERDAVVRELEVVSEKVVQVDAYIDDYIHADVDYSTYLDVRNMVDSIVNWEYESEWRGVQKD